MRLATAAFGIPLILALDYLGGPAFGIALGLAALLAGWELYRMLLAALYRPAYGPGLLTIVLLALLPLQLKSLEGVPACLTALVLVAGLWFLAPTNYSNGFVNWVFTIIPALYVGVLLGYVAALRVAQDGAWWVLILLFITWGYDTGAFAAGRALGRHRFMTHVSPKKTVEGVAGGLLLSAIGALIAVPAVGLSPWQAVALGLLGGAVVQVGDLIESMIKRQTGVKDSGEILPGHGGVLDRIDGLLFAAPLVYYAARILGYGS